MWDVTATLPWQVPGHKVCADASHHHMLCTRMSLLQRQEQRKTVRRPGKRMLFMSASPTELEALIKTSQLKEDIHIPLSRTVGQYLKYTITEWRATLLCEYPPRADAQPLVDADTMSFNRPISSCSSFTANTSSPISQRRLPAIQRPKDGEGTKPRLGYSRLNYSHPCRMNAEADQHANRKRPGERSPNVLSETIAS